MSKLVAENDIKDENWLDLPGEEKVEEQPDTHWNSASIFTLRKEDHTVANLLRMKLHTNKFVRFAAYKHPHPTIHNVEFSVQTAPVHQPGTAGAAAASNTAVPTPADAMLQAIREVVDDINTFDQLWKEVERQCNAAAESNSTAVTARPSGGDAASAVGEGDFAPRSRTASMAQGAGRRDDDDDDDDDDYRNNQRTTQQQQSYQ